MLNRIFFILILAVTVSSVFSISTAYAAVPGTTLHLGPAGDPTPAIINLQWTAPVDGGAPTGYVVQAALENPSTHQLGPFLTIATLGDVTAYSHTGLTAGVFYEYKVHATNGEGAGPSSFGFGMGTPFNVNKDYGNEQQNFADKGTFSIDYTLPSRTTATTEWADVFDDLGIGSVIGQNSKSFPHNTVLYVDFEPTITTGEQYNDVLFTDANSNGIIDCVNAATCELADMTQAVSYVSGTNTSFAYEQTTVLTQGAKFAEGQTFAKGQTFDKLYDFSNGPVVFPPNAVFTVQQNFDDVGTFSGAKVLSLRTTATTEWADVFSDAGITSVAGQNSATYSTNTILYADFGGLGVTNAMSGGSNWNDILFTDANSNGIIDCSHSFSCELADLNNAVSYAAGTTVTFDYVQQQNTPPGMKPVAGQTFGKGQGFDNAIDLTQGTMNFGTDTNFEVFQNFAHVGTFSGERTLPERTSATIEWADVFSDLSITQVSGLDHTLLVAANYTTNTVLYADFSALTAGSYWNDILFTDGNGNKKIDCINAATCELADMTQAVSYASGTTVIFDYPQPQVFGPGTVFAPGQTFAKGQTFANDVDWSQGAMNIPVGAKFMAQQNFAESGAFSHQLTLSERTTTTTEWADVFSDIGITSITGYDQSTGKTVQPYVTGKIIFQDFSSVTAGSFWNDILFTDGNGNGIIDCVNAATCELADMTQAVSYAAGTTMKFDYVIPQSFENGNIFFAGETFAPGQIFDKEVDFSGGAMNFGIATDFTMIQPFEDTGTFSKASVLGVLDARTTATTEWADVFDDLGPIALVEGFNAAGTASANYTTGAILYADFSNVNVGSNWNDILFTDANSNFKIDCATAGSCELADLSAPVTYEAGTVVSFNHVLPHDFGAGTEFLPGQTFGQGQVFDQIMNFSKGSMTFVPAMEFAPNQNFEQQTDFTPADLIFKAGSVFPTAATYGIGANFTAGVVDLKGANTFDSGAIFADNQTFDTTQVFNGTNTFGEGLEFGGVQNFANLFEGSGNLPLNVLATGTTDWYTVLQALDTPANKVEALVGTYSSGVIYADFSAVTFGSAINDVVFTDANSNGIIDCINVGAGCELADLPSPVTFANTATIVFEQGSTQTFGADTVFVTGTSFAKGQSFDETQSFATGMAFAPGMEFADSQSFTGQDNFEFENMEFGVGSDFDSAMDFGNAANFTAGVVDLKGTNTFGEDSLFADSQTFTAVQLFNGTNTFGDSMTFSTNQDFGSLEVFSNLVTNSAITVKEVNFFDILSNTTGSPTTVTGGSSGSFETGLIYADFSAVLGGSAINDVLFTDTNKNGIIDCVNDGTCELADLPAADAVLVASGTTISFEQDPIQTFGSSTVFATGTTFANNQNFDTTQIFATNVTFAPGMEFADSQSFTGQDNFDFKDIEFGVGSDFDSAVTFGESANFTAGVQLFDGTNSFGGDSLFANSQAFTAVQTFAGENTFGTGTTFSNDQDFSTAGTVTSASIAVATDVLINDMTKQNAAFPSIPASSGIFENGLVTITFSDVDVGTQDKIQEVIFTDADKDGIIDDGELGAITAVTTSSDTMTITQALVQDFDAGAQTFGTGVTFNENQSFGEDNQTFGTGTTFNGNANFTVTQTFVADIIFDDGQDLSALTDSSALSATGMTFGSAESVDFGTNAKTFGASATFATNQDFTEAVNHDLSAADLTFGADTTFLSNASEVFGEHVNFAGVIEFPDDQAFPAGAEFADGQSFDAEQDPDFGDFTTFGNNVSFAEGLDFDDAPNFEGTTSFTGTNTFGAGTEFETGVTFTASQTFSGAVDFGVADLSAATQTIQDGSQFAEGSTFADSQSLPTGTVLSGGLLLGTTTCSGAANDCIPADDGDILVKGEKLASGVTIPAIKNTITKDNPTLSIDGLGIEVVFTDITTDGNLDVTVQDPAVTIANTGATASGTDGAIAFEAGGKSMTTFSSIIDFDLTGTTASSGAMTITLPYDAAATAAAGFAEDNLEVSHFVGGQWVIENNCTVDTVANDITCIVDSVE